MKKLTLNQTWTLCLRMWRWIAKEWKKTGKSVHLLKIEWLKQNGFNPKAISCECFFCERDNQQREEGENYCHHCPARQINPNFHCEQIKEYFYAEKPIAFLAELLRLNRIRKAKK